MSTTDGMRADWATKDFYAVLGVKKDASPTRSRRPTASWRAPTTPTPTPATPPSTTTSRRWPRPTTSSATPRSARSTTRCARSAPSRAPAASAAGSAAVAAASTSTTCCATARAAGRRWLRRHVRRPLRPGGRRPQPRSSGARRRAPTSRPRRRSASPTPSTASRSRCGSPPTRRAPTARAPAASPAPSPHICPECEGAGFVVASVGGAFSMNETCPACGGRQLVYDEPCPTCHGSGRGMSARTIQARIPAGVKDGQRIRLRGKGAAGEDGGPAGDLFVTVKVSPHRLFGRKGDNLTLDVPVSFDELALGAELKIPTLGGAPVTLKVPAGHARTGAPSGSAAAGPRKPTAPAATCSPPSRSTCRRVLDEAARDRGRRPTATRPGRSRCGPSSSRTPRPWPCASASCRRVPTPRSS